MPGDEITVTLMRRVSKDRTYIGWVMGKEKPKADDQVAVFKATIPAVPTPT